MEGVGEVGGRESGKVYGWRKSPSFLGVYFGRTYMASTMRQPYRPCIYSHFKSS